ncbi:MAG: AAA family ATPase [Deltaproteobacteria bacterium]|nr:AAA family ATPase [Deltaproteobacteria bacterium]
MALHFKIFYHSRKNGDHLRQVIDASGSGQMVEADDLSHLPTTSRNGTDVFLLEYQENNPKLDQWIEDTAADPNNPAVFLVFPEISTLHLWKALHLGVKECFTLPVQPQEFQEAVSRLLVRNTIKAPQRDSSNDKMIAFLGCKGGIGATFLASNLAYLLSREYRGQALLVDLDMQYAQMVHFFDVKTRHSLSEAVVHLEELDQSFLQNLLYPYNKFLSLLPAPARLEEAETVTPDNLGKILSYLKNMPTFRWILLDVGHHIDEITLKALEHSDHLVMVTNPSIPALANTRKWLDLLQLLELKIPLEIWLNAWNKNADLTLAEAANYLGMEVRGAIPFDAEAVVRSINDGHPLAETAPRHPVCQALRSLGVGIAGLEAAAEAPSSGWSWLKRLGGRS